MEKFKKLGKILSKNEQKRIKGGTDEEIDPPCGIMFDYCRFLQFPDTTCCPGYQCINIGNSNGWHCSHG